jgi:hypothetical protein
MNNTNTPLINLINELPSAESPATRENRLLSNSIFRAVNIMIERNADIVNERDYELNTPLHFAIFKGNNVIMRLLLQNGADVNAQNVRGDTPLHWAVYPPGNIAAVNTLLEFNADTNITNIQDATPFDIAENIASTVEDIDFEEYEDIMDALENHVVRPRAQRVQEYPEFTESEFFKHYSSGDECYICYEPLADGSEICVNTNEKCRHGFHCRCIRPWLQSGHNSCPVCKEPFTLQPLGEMQQRALQNSFGKKRKSISLRQLTKFETYLYSL